MGVHPTSPSASDSDDARWFVDEVHPHGPLLKAYLRGSFPAVRDIDDVVQESYLRIWRSRAGQPIRSAKALLFRVARNVALDLIRRGRNSPITAVGDLEVLPVIEERPDVIEVLSTDEKLNLLGSAIAGLPRRGRELVLLCHLQGLSRREAAARLGIAEKTADEHLYRALKRLGKTLRRAHCDPAS